MAPSTSVKNTARSLFSILFSILSLWLFLLPFVEAQPEILLEEYKAKFTIVEDTVIVEETFTFASTQKSFSWSIPKDAEAIETTNGNLQWVEEEKEQFKELKVTGSFNLLTIKYLTESLLEKTKDNFFITDLGRVRADKIEIKVILPEGAKLKYPLGAVQTALIPKTEKLSTDGQSMVINWTEEELGAGKAIVVIYQERTGLTSNEKGSIFMVALAILSGFGYLVIKKRKTHQEQKTEEKEDGHDTTLEERLTRNLFEEERAIIVTLLKAKERELWQKQLQLQTGISAVKLSRKLRNLEAKGLIEKIPYGNTNKIRIKEIN